MRSFLGLVAALAAAFVLFALSAGQALGNHVQCGDVITQDTTLDSDLNCTGNGLVVHGSDLTLNLGGHVIRGDGNDIGIHLEGTSGITVEGGRVENFASAIDLGSYEDASSGAILRRLQIVDSSIGVRGLGGSANRIEDSLFGNSGIQLYHASFALVQQNNFDEGGVFIDQQEGSGSVVRDNVGGVLNSLNGEDLTVEGNRFSGGIEIGGVDEVRIAHNSVRYIALEGDGANSVIEQNVVRGDEGAGGIFVWATFNHSRISGNSITEAGGIRLRNASDSRIEGNSISDAGGISLTDNANSNLIVGNSIRESAGDGIAVQEGSTGTLVEGNKVLRNGDDGLDLKDSSTSVFDNRAWFNGDLGIEAVPGVTGSGNWAKHNGNPAECVPSYLCQGPVKPKT